VTPRFIPGIELARLFYAEQVRPLLASAFPRLPHSAALIGWGSEVLGFDTARSTDHNWGPRLQLFLADNDDTANLAASILGVLADRLPAEFRGYPTVFAASEAAPETASHWVEVAGLRAWLAGYLGFDPLAGVTLLDWLSTPTQTLAEVTGGAVFHDGLAYTQGGPAGPGGGLVAARSALAWYPDDVWRYVLACQWQRIDQEEPFPGRCVEAGDDLGSSLVTARLVRDLVRLVLLMQRQYPLYSKWLGTAFARAGAGAQLLPSMTGALAARSWPEREDCLCAAYEAAARLHNGLGLTGYIDPAVRPSFFDRPYRVLGAARFAEALLEGITDDHIRALPPAGAIDQFVDSTDAINNKALLRDSVSSMIQSRWSPNP